MSRPNLSITAVAVAFAIAASACTRDESGPEVQTTSGVQPRQESITVNGCLKAGLGENTFVLTAEQTGAGTETATYQLSAPSGQLRDHVGEQVRVSGTLRSEQQVASTGRDVVDEPASGTSGTPTIETRSELNVKQLTVESVEPTGQRCAE
jgi:hypothetical protein